MADAGVFKAEFVYDGMPLLQAVEGLMLTIKGRRIEITLLEGSSYHTRAKEILLLKRFEKVVMTHVRDMVRDRLILGILESPEIRKLCTSMRLLSIDMIQQLFTKLEERGIRVKINGSGTSISIQITAKGA